MTYLEFLIVFLVLPLVVIITSGRRVWRTWPWPLLAGLSVVALLYTGPWDNLIVNQHVWSYAPQRVLGTTIGVVPIEEYAFYVLQVLLAGIVSTVLLRRSLRR